MQRDPNPPPAGDTCPASGGKEQAEDCAGQRQRHGPVGGGGGSPPREPALTRGPGAAFLGGPERTPVPSHHEFSGNPAPPPSGKDMWRG